MTSRIHPRALRAFQPSAHGNVYRVLTSTFSASGPNSTAFVVATPAPAPAPIRTATARCYSTRQNPTTPARSAPVGPVGSVGPVPALRPDTVNPPASTRPPPLDLPERADAPNLPTHLFRTGRAYLTFYKTGVRAIWTNRNLLRAARQEQTTGPTLGPPTRAHLLLARRVSHDLARLPAFGLLLLLCGEFTPFVVLLLPRLVPFTCRVPAQEDKIARQLEARRAEAFAALPWAADTVPDAAAAAAATARSRDGRDQVAHVARSLGLASPLWDRLGPGRVLGITPLAALRARRHVRFLLRDDALLRDGGASALEAAEVALACRDRGIDVREKDERELRYVLDRWLELSGPNSLGDEERHKRVTFLLTTRPEQWSLFKA